MDNEILMVVVVVVVVGGGGGGGGGELWSSLIHSLWAMDKLRWLITPVPNELMHSNLNMIDQYIQSNPAMAIN